MKGFRILFLAVFVLVTSVALGGCSSTKATAGTQTGLVSVSYTEEGTFDYQDHNCAIYTHFNYNPPPPGEFPIKKADEQLVVVRSPICMVEPVITWKGKEYAMSYAYMDGSIPYTDYTFVLPKNFALKDWDPKVGFRAVHRDDEPLSQDLPGSSEPPLLQ